MCIYFFFFNDTATTEIYTLSLHDALPICVEARRPAQSRGRPHQPAARELADEGRRRIHRRGGDRKSTRLNSSHANISYAVFCLKKHKSHLSYAHSPTTSPYPITCRQHATH